MRYLLLVLLVVCTNSLDAQMLDSLAIKQVDSLIKVSRELTGKKDFEKALEVNGVAEKLSLEKLGKESAGYGSCAFNRGRVNYFRGDYKEAEKWYLESKAIREKILGKEHIDYAWSLNNLGMVNVSMGKYEKAEIFYLESKGIREKLLGILHPDYASSLYNLALLYKEKGEKEKAEKLFLEVISLKEKVLGKLHPDYVTRLCDLASFYISIFKYEKAEPLYIESKNIREKVLGKEHPDYVNSLNDLAFLYYSLGKFEKAEPLYIESKNICEKVLGKEHRDYVKSLTNLAALYISMDNYEKAEPLYLESRNIREKVLGKEHLLYAKSLANLVKLYYRFGNYEKAESLCIEEKNIIEKIYGKDHPSFASSLHSLGNLYFQMGNYEKAESFYLESKAIREKAFGKEHPDYAKSLANLALINSITGKYKDAEVYYIESNDILEKVLGKEHPDFAKSLNLLGSNYYQMGSYDKAEQFLLKAKDICSKAQGKENFNYAEFLSDLGKLYETQKRFSESEQLLNEVSSLEQSWLAKAAGFLSEKELAKYAKSFQKSGNNLSGYLLARQSYKAQTGLLHSLTYDNTLFYKGFLLTAVSRMNSFSATSKESWEIKERLKGYRQQLAEEYSKPLADRKNIADLEEKANMAEKELARSVTGYADALRKVKWEDVKANLKQSEAAIEFVHFQVDFPRKSDSTMYVALLILPGSVQPKFIPLFEEKSLDSLLHSKSDRKADYVNALYTLSDRGAVAIEAPKKSLYEILWQPLEKELTSIKTIYFSPSGLLHRINLAAIPVSETETLADRFNLIELTSTRQLVIPNQIKVANNDAVLFGGIQFEQDSLSVINEPIYASRSRSELSFSSIDSTLRGGTWSYLAGTEREVNIIEKIMKTSGLQASLKKGYQATEESFKNISSNNAVSPRILHIATHGYFFPDPKGTDKKSILDGEQESVFKISDHPMLRSGLIMAGGNAAWQGKQTLEGREDGILTAYEISQMNLSNTELVVLSACETGLGDIQGNEGVYGLQRAFKIAGVKYLIMSLWQVPDKQTSMLMTTFYKKWLENKMTIPDAFHTAQKELREIGLDPYQWAGFVLVE